MFRRDLLKNLLMVIPASLAFNWRRVDASTKLEQFAPHRIVKRQELTDITGLSRLQTINAALGGEVEGDYRGFPYSWTGFKNNHEDIKIVGQWLTYSFTNRKPMFLHREGLHLPTWVEIKIGEPVFIMSSAPGTSGPFHKGATFNIASQPWQDLLTLETPLDILEQERAKALEVLKFEIDAYLDGPHKEIFKYRQLKPIGANEVRPPFLIESDISINQWLRKMITKDDYSIWKLASNR